MRKSAHAVVDDHMRSVADPDVYAVGECAEHRGRVYGLVAPLWEQAKVFAEHITGRNPDAAYVGSKLATKLKVMGVELASMGIIEPAGENDEVIQYTEAKKGTYKKLIVRDGRLVGGILMGDISKAAYLMQCFDRDAPLPEERVSLLFDLGGAGRQLTAAEMPADMQVCNCNGVSKGTIAACFAGGMRDAPGVMNATRAGKGCGSCKGLVGEIVTWLCGQEAAEDPAIAARNANPLPTAALSELRDGQPGWERHAGVGKEIVFPGMPESDGGSGRAELKRIGGVALKYNVALVELTGAPRIDLVGLPRDGLPGLWRDFEMPAAFAAADADRSCRTCIGIDYCRFGQGDSMGLAAKIEGRFRSVDDPGHLMLATAGCRATARKRKPATSARSRSATATGRSMSAAPAARTCARGRCSASQTPKTTCSTAWAALSGSIATARQPGNPPAPSSNASASSGSERSWPMPAKPPRRRSTRRCRSLRHK
jgi:nitrite reductase (NADH) large subunit